MSDPERLSVASDSELERLLLRSGRTPAPDTGRHQALLAATAALGASGLVAGSAAAGSAVAKTGSVMSLKWLAVLGVAGIGAMTAAVAVDHGGVASAPSHRVEAPTTVLASAARPGVLPRPAAVPSASASPGPAPVESALAPTPPAPSSLAVRAAGPEPAGSSVHAELATLEQARATLAAGDPARALSLLDAYGTTFPRGSMGPEATVLRVEALVRAGDRAAAERVGSAFLASNPQSPYAARIRSLLGASNP